MRLFGNLKARIVRDGTSLPDADILIAATCLSRCDRLITGNFAHFERFVEIRIENCSDISADHRPGDAVEFLPIGDLRL